MALCTVAEYKAERGIAVTGWDTLIGTEIDAATAEIERLTGRTAGGFEGGSFVETFDGDGSQVLRVSNGPISSITYVKTGNATQTTVSASSYTFKDRTILMIPKDNGGAARRDSWGDWMPVGSRSPSFPDGYGNVEVSYTTSDAVDDDLKRVCFEFVDHYMKRRGGDFAVATEAIGNTNVTMRTVAEFNEAKLALVGPWRPIR